MVFVNKISQIVQVVTGFIDSIVAIAGGADRRGGHARREDARRPAVAGDQLPRRLRRPRQGRRQGHGRDREDPRADRQGARLADRLDRHGGQEAGQRQSRRRACRRIRTTRFKQGMEKAEAAVNKFAGKQVGQIVLNPLLAAIKVRYGFKKLELFKAGTFWGIEGSMSPAKKVTTKAKVGEGGAEGDKVMKIERTHQEARRPHGRHVDDSRTGSAPKHPAGSKPESGAQKDLMELLVTDPSQSSPDKFIRGASAERAPGRPGQRREHVPDHGQREQPAPALHRVEGQEVGDHGRALELRTRSRSRASRRSSTAASKSPKNFVAVHVPVPRQVEGRDRQGVRRTSRRRSHPPTGEGNGGHRRSTKGSGKHQARERYFLRTERPRARSRARRGRGAWHARVAAA